MHEDADFFDERRLFENRGFNLFRVDVFAARQHDNVLFAPGDEQVAIRVNMPQIARMQPAVLHHRRRFFRAIVIALHDVAAFGENFAVHDFHVVAGQRMPA